MSEILITKVFLEIPFSHIKFAKENKLVWSKEEKKWAISSDHLLFKSICHKYKRVTLRVPYADKDIVKMHDAKWNHEEKTWETFNGNKILYEYMDEEV